MAPERALDHTSGFANEEKDYETTNAVLTTVSFSP
jgi:hypothetical protein